MRNAFLTIAIVGLMALPSKAAITYTDVFLFLSGPGFSQSVDGTSLNDPGSSGSGWTFTADLVTNISGSPGAFTSPDIVFADLDNVTLTCTAIDGCGAATVRFSAFAYPTNPISRDLPWNVEISGTKQGLNATFTSTLSNSSYTPANSSFDFIRNGRQVFTSPIGYNASFTVTSAADGATLTLPFDVTFNAPEPATIGLTGMMLAGLGLIGFKFRHKR